MWIQSLCEAAMCYWMYGFTSSQMDEDGLKKYRDSKKFLKEIDLLTDHVILNQRKLVKDVLTTNKNRKEKIQFSNINEFFAKLRVDQKYLFLSPEEEIQPLKEFGSFECFTPAEIQHFLDYGPSIPSSYSSHPLLSILTLQAKCEKKAELLEERGIELIDEVSYETNTTRASQFKPHEAMNQVAFDSLSRIGYFGACWLLIQVSIIINLPEEEQKIQKIPMFRPISGPKIPFIKQRGRGLLLLAPLAFLSIQFIDPLIKELKITETVCRNDLNQIMMKTEQRIAAIPPTIPEYTRKAIEKEINYDKETALLELRRDLTAQAVRPALWLGTTMDDPFTKEGAWITLFFHPLTDIIVFYGIFLKSLLSLIRPLPAHIITACMYVFCKDFNFTKIFGIKFSEDPDIMNIVHNLSSLDGSVAKFIQSLLEQLLFRVSGGSIALTYLLGLIHRSYYYFLQEAFASVTVSPIEHSPFALTVMRVQAQLFSLFTSNERVKDKKLLWENFFRRPNDMKPFPKEVLEEVPDADKILLQFSEKLLQQYGSPLSFDLDQYIPESEADHLKIKEVYECLQRLEHYKRQNISSSNTTPLFFIDEDVIKKLLLFHSPLFLEGRLTSMLEQSPPLTHVIQAQLLAMKDPTNTEKPLNPITNRLSYLKYVQPSYAQYELSEVLSFLKRDDVPTIPSLDSKSLYGIQMKGVSSLMESFYLSILDDLYPKRVVNLSELDCLIRSYFMTMEPKTMIEEIRKLDEAMKSKTNINEKNLYSYMTYYDSLLFLSSKEERCKKKEEFLKIVNAVCSSVKIADENFFQFMEPLLFSELKSSFAGRAAAFLPSSSQDSSLQSEVTSIMRAKREMFFNRLFEYQETVRARYVESVLSEYGLTSTHFQFLVKMYASKDKEVAALLNTWEDYFDPKPAFFWKNVSHEDVLSKLLVTDETRRLVYQNGTILKALSLSKDRWHYEEYFSFINRHFP